MLAFPPHVEKGKSWKFLKYIQLFSGGVKNWFSETEKKKFNSSENAILETPGLLKIFYASPRCTCSEKTL